MSSSGVAKPNQGNIQSEAANNSTRCCDATKKTAFSHENISNQPNVMVINKGNAQKSKATYSAQHQAPNLAFQQYCKRNTSDRFPSMGTSYPCCNAIPLYDISSRMMNKGQNIPTENIPNNMQRSCPCSSVPPPMPPCNNDLWDLQFCRWWGWNWIRKREEMMNQKKAGMKTKCDECADKRGKNKKKQRGRKQGDFFNWCNKLFKKHSKNKLKVEEKKQMQELYDTPCSSVTFNNCPCPADQWECRSLNLEGQYKCYCSSTRQTSMSTVVVQNKTRRQICKQNMRKHQSWMCEKTDSSSSDECCPYVCVHPKMESSTEESIEYLSLRMAHMKSDCEDNLECPCMKLKQVKKNCPKNICCQWKAQKKQNTNVCCPCKVKLICEKQNNCTCNKVPKQNCVVKQHNFTKCNCSFGGTQGKPNLPRCRVLSPSRSLPICRPSAPPKIPRFRRLPQTCKCLQQNINPVLKNFGECRRQKRKNCCCSKRNEYMLCCACKHQPRKKLKRSEKPAKVYYYCCCCCCHNCCCCGNTKSESAEDSKASEPKHVVNSKQTSDKGISSNNINEKVNPNGASCCNNVQPQTYGLHNGNFVNGSPTGDYIQDNFVYNAMQFRVSTALQKGLYTSPVSGRPYNLNLKVSTPNKISLQNHLPKPLNIDHKVLSINPVDSPIVDEEHKLLLTAVCDAIMSSRLSKESQHQNYALHSPAGSSFLPSNNYCPNFDPLMTKNLNIYGNLESFDQRSVEVGIHDYSDDEKENGGFCCELENFTNNNIAVDKYQQLSENYKNVLTPSVLKATKFEIPDASKHKGLHTPDFKNVLAPHFEVSEIFGNEKLETSALKNLLSPNTVSNYETDCNQKSVENISRKTRIPVRRKKCSLVQQLRPSELEKPTSNAPQKVVDVIQIGQINPGNHVKGLYSDSNSLENCSKGESVSENSLPYSSNPPTIQKSSPIISGRNSFESLYSDKDCLPLIKNCVGLSNSLIPFHLQQNLMKPPKLSGLTVTGLFSTFRDITELPSDPSCIDGTDNRENINTNDLKKGRLYNMLVSSDRSNCYEDFLKAPYNFPPIPAPPYVIQHPTTYPSFIVQKSPLSDDAEGTQTNQPAKKARTCHCERYLEKQQQCDCMSLGKHSTDKKKLEKETSCRSLLEVNVEQSKSPRATTSKTTKTGNVSQYSKSAQAGTSKGTQANVIMQDKPPQAGTSKASETNTTVYSKVPQASTSKAIDVNTTMPLKSPHEATVNRASLQLKSLQDGTSKGIEVSSTSGLKPSSAVSPQVVDDYKSPTAGSSKAAVTNATGQSKLLQTGTSKKPEANSGVPFKRSQGASSRVAVGPKSPQAGSSKAVKSNSVLMSKLPHTTNSETVDDMLTQQADQNITFAERNSEKEMGCTFFHAVDSKKLQKCKRCASPFKNDSPSDYFVRNPDQELEENCLYYEHEPQNLNFYADVKTKASEKLLSVINRISEAHVKDLPFLTKDIQTSSSLFDKPGETATINKFTSTTEYQNLFPKSFVSAATSPFLIDTTTSPFKIKYTTVRAQDRPQPENFIREKVPKRESPFSMFCRPVPSKNVAQTSPSSDETQSLSRPERQIVVAQPKKLKVREKRWRY